MEKAEGSQGSQDRRAEREQREIILCRVKVSTELARRRELLSYLAEVGQLQIPSMTQCHFRVNQEHVEMYCHCHNHHDIRLSEGELQCLREAITETAWLFSRGERPDLPDEDCHAVNVFIDNSTAWQAGSTEAESRPGLGQELQEETELSANILVNSNMAGLTLTGDCDQRDGILKLSSIVAGARKVNLRIVGNLRTDESLWEIWNSCGFWVEWSSVAQCVLQHLKNLERWRADPNREVFAFCIDDDQLVDTVENVARRGWNVEIWCWRASCPMLVEATRNVSHLTSRVKICCLDDFNSWLGSSGSPLAEIPRAELHEEPYGFLNERQPDLCAICLSEEAIFSLKPCNHRVLCRACLGPWMEQRPEPACPLCRRPFCHIS
ncbi:unnamed protein product [Durusdinium trenchii]|uniref:RING-type domain-containing protein n=1 Tax=Durusdinium trenchii TaxID=1381693 RepID=A0ABP0RR80_9DINO